LQIPNGPDPCPVVASHDDRLPNIRLGREEIHRDSVRHNHPARCVCRTVALASPHSRRENDDRQSERRHEIVI
jgi:hypothetical protein